MTASGPWAAGQAIGRYRLEGTIGRGGMGEVWLARDAVLGRRVALKHLPADLKVTPEIRARLLREARALAAITSPHVVALHGVESLDGAGADLVLVMEYLEGRTLHEVLRAGPLPAAEALKLFRQIAAGLAAAHAAGAVHRDLKPSNILLKADGTLVILDFGLALLEEPEREEQLTQSGLLMGTAGYMAPEQARGLHVDARSDVWAAGVVLYEMLSGQRPFPGRTHMEQIAAVLRDDPLPLAAPGVPDEVARLVDACLQKDPARRLRDGRELLSRLPQDVVPVMASEPMLIAPEVLARARAHAPLGRGRARLAAAAAVAGLLLGVGAAIASWPAAARRPLAALDRHRAALDGLLQAEGLDGLTHTAAGYTPGPGGEVQAWVRRSRASFLDPRRPPSAEFPAPGTAEEVRASFDASGRLLTWEQWPGESGTRPGQLERLASAAGLALPLTRRRTLAGLERGAPVEEWAGADGRSAVVARQDARVLHFGTQAWEPEAPLEDGSMVAVFVLAAVLAIVAGARARLRAGAADLRSAAALAGFVGAWQILKLVFNPVTLVSGIWLPVTLEAGGLSLLVMATYAALEPAVRARWPGTLAGWARLAHARAPDEHVGREVLLGAAAWLPAALTLRVLALAGQPVLDPAHATALFGLGTPGFHLYLVFDLVQRGVLAATLVLIVASFVVRLAPPLFALAVGAACTAALFLGASSLPAAAAVAALVLVLALRGGLLAIAVFVAGVLGSTLAVPFELGAWSWPYLAPGPLLALGAVAWGLRLATRRPGAETARHDPHRTASALEAPTAAPTEAPTAAVLNARDGG